MATYPRKPRSAFLEWCRAHETVFTTHAAEIGLSADEALAFTQAAELGGTRLLEQEAAKEAAKVATQRVTDAFDDLGKTAGNVVRRIRAFAEASADPDAVYAVAQIPPRSQPSPQPAPGQPTDLTVTLDPTEGTITLRWKSDNPDGTSGTAYIIRRRLPGETEFMFVGVSGKKSFVDETLIAGPDSVQYTVQGQRANLSGPVSPIFTVNFGKLPNGTRSACVSTLTTDTARWNVDIPAPSGKGQSAAVSR
jgi:hypothetical protein